MKVKQYLLYFLRAECFRLTGLLLLIGTVVMLSPQNASGQHPAVPKLTLAQVEDLVSHNVPDSTLSTQIQRRGVAFTPNQAILESLRMKGAGPLTLAAIEELSPKGTPNALIKPAGGGSLSQTALARPVSILTVNNLFDYNGRKMDEWQPLLQMLKEMNATITEANSNVNPDDFDIVFLDICLNDNSAFFPRVRNLVKNGKVIILTADRCRLGSRPSSEVANDVLRDFGMEFTLDDPGNQFANSTGNHAIMNGVGSFLTFRSPSIIIHNEGNVLPLAMNGGNVLLAAYEDRASRGLLVATGEGAGFLFGAYDQSSKTQDHKELLIMRNIISYARSISAKSKESISDRAESAAGGPSLAVTMQFIQDKLNGLGRLTYAQTFQTPSGHTFSNTFTVEASNVFADQSQCRISYHLKRNMDSPTPQVLTDGDQSFSLHDAKDVGVKPYAQYLTEQNAIHGPHLVILSTAPPLSALVVHPAEGKDTIFPFTDDVLAGRVAKALDHAVTLCGGSKSEPF